MRRVDVVVLFGPRWRLSPVSDDARAWLAAQVPPERWPEGTLDLNERDARRLTGQMIRRGFRLQQVL